MNIHPGIHHGGGSPARESGATPCKSALFSKPLARCPTAAPPLLLPQTLPPFSGLTVTLLFKKKKSHRCSDCERKLHLQVGAESLLMTRSCQCQPYVEKCSRLTLTNLTDEASVINSVSLYHRFLANSTHRWQRIVLVAILGESSSIEVDVRPLHIRFIPE